MAEWISETLSPVLGQDVCEDIAGYIATIQNASDFDEFMKTLLDCKKEEHRELCNYIKSILFECEPNQSGPSTSTYSILKDDSSSPVTDQDSKKQKKCKKYTKYQLSELQKGFLRSGRNPCICQATKHKLINNCIECGRIVCEQEGSGPCFFCDSMVCTLEEKEVLDSNTKHANILYRTLTERKKSENWKKAVESRDQLLHYDKQCTLRTKVIDDEHDYFDVNNKWLTADQRTKIAKKKTQEYEVKHASRLENRKMTLDILEKRVIMEPGLGYEYEEASEEEIERDRIKDMEREKQNISDFNKILETLKSKNNLVSKKPGVVNGNVDNLSDKLQENCYIIQDKMYLEMRDLGKCLSMHQPWASLLIHGIKKHEGRSWYTPHRGKLWIAAAAKEPDQQDIAECENFYKKYYEGSQIVFPSKYFTGCLLGCVLVQDCLSQEEYQEQYPEGESCSPYVLICSDPTPLPVSFPMQGDHKIFKLDANIHKMAKDAMIIQRCKT